MTRLLKLNLQSVKKYFEKFNKVSNIELGWRTLISAFAQILAAIAKNYFLRGDWTLTCVSTRFWDFLFIFEFTKILSPTLYGKPWQNSYTEFTMLDIKHRFTCGYLNFHGNTTNCKYIMSLFVEFSTAGRKMKFCLSAFPKNTTWFLLHSKLITPRYRGQIF